MKQEVDQLLSQGQEGVPLSEFIRASARCCLQAAIEQEATEFLGRAHYQRGPGQRTGYRNGYHSKNLASAEGPLRVQLPQLRATQEPFRSQLAQGLAATPGALEKLVVGMYVRGLSTRDIEDLFSEVTGGQMVSKSAVSELSQVWEEDFQRWRNRSLAQLEPLYFFLDAFYLPLRSGSTEKEGILAAYAILRSGKKVLIHLALGGRENYDSWLAFLHDLTEREFKAPALAISDGNPGLKKALRRIWPEVNHQRCQRHKLLNILVKLPKAMQAEMKRLVQQVFWADSFEEGLHKGRALIERFKERYPAAMDCLEKDLEACLLYLKFPEEHRVRIRTTNGLERIIEEVKRRTKVVGRLPSEAAALKLVFAVASTYSRQWRGIAVTPQQLAQIDQVVAAAKPQREERAVVTVGSVS
jgi:transposase-like protein